MIFVDGENLVYRYQAMRAEDRVPRDGVLHKEDAYVWHPDIARFRAWDLIRTGYYTSQVGDENKIYEMELELSSVRYKFIRPSRLRDYGFIVPRVFKKPSASQKVASVDINICIDAMRHSYSDTIDEILLLTGDGDYIPLIQDIMRRGKIVYVGAFSSGLNPAIPKTADEFLDLDAVFFDRS
ncbi:MAG: NYN domain-containing protein [Planctomycetes bacterium]|nr:NYN domain-containing protein [Planctomycetota bacterium]